LNRFDNILEAVVETYDLKDTMQSRDFGCDILLGKGKGTAVDYHGDPQQWDMAKLETLGFSQDGDRQLLVAVLSFTEMLLTCCGNRSIYLSSGHLDHLLNSTYNDVAITTLKVGQQLAERYSASVKRLGPSPTRHMSMGLLRNHYNIELDKVKMLAKPFVKTPLARFSDPAPATPASAGKGKDKDKAHFGGPKNVAPKYANDLKYIMAPDSDTSQHSWNGWGDIKVVYYPKSATKPEAQEKTSDNAAPADRIGTSSTPVTPTPLRRSTTMPTSQTPRAARPVGTGDDSSPVQPRTPATAGHEETASASQKVLEVSQAAVMSHSIYELLARCPPDMPLDNRYEYLHRLRVAKALLGSSQDRQEVLAMRLLAINNLAFILPEDIFLDTVLRHDDEEPRRTQLVYQLADLIHPAGDGEQEVPLSLQTLAFSLLEIVSHFPAKHNDVLSALNANVNHGVLLYVVRKAVERMAQDAVEEDRQKQEEQDRWTFALLQLAFQLGLEARLAPEIMSAGLMDSLIEVLKLRTPTALRFHASVFTFLDQLVANIHGHFNQATITPGSLEAVADLLHFTVTRAQELVDAGRGNPPEMRTTIVDYDVPFYQQQTLKWGLKFIHRIMSHFSFGANTDRVLRNMVDNSALLRSLRSVIEGKQLFGSVVWTNTVTLLSDFLNHDPTSFAAIQESGMIRGFLQALTGREVTVDEPPERPPLPPAQSRQTGGDRENRDNQDDGEDGDNGDDDGEEPSSPAESENTPDWGDDARPHPPTQAMLEAPREVPIARGILPSGEAISIVPSILNSICLNNVGMKMVVQSRVLDTLMEVFESPEHVRLVDSSDGDCFHGLGAGLDELARHHPNLRQHVGNAIVDMLARVVHLAYHKESVVALGARLLVKDSQGKAVTAGERLHTASKGKEKAVPDDQDVEMPDASTAEAADAGASSDPSTTAPNSPLFEGSILPHLLALQIFFEGAIQQNNHIKSTIYKAGGIELLLQLMEAPSLPASQVDDSRGLRGLIVTASSFIAEKPIIGVPSLLRRLQKALDTLESLATYSGPRPFFNPFLQKEGGVHDKEQVADGTRLVKAILHAQLLMRTLSQCFPQGRQSAQTFPNANVYDYYARFIKALSPLLHSFQKEEMAIPDVVPSSWLQWCRSKLVGTVQTKNQVLDVLHDPRQRVTGPSEISEPVATAAAESSVPGAAVSIGGGENGPPVIKLESINSLAYAAHDKESKPSAEDQASPQFLNFKTLMGLLNGFQLSAFSLVQNIGKALFGRSKDRDAYTRYRHMQLAELIADIMVLSVEDKNDTDPREYASWIVMLHNIQELLLTPSRYTERQTPFLVLPVLIAFKEKGGLDMLNTMVRRFADVVLQGEDPAATDNHGSRQTRQLAALGMSKLLEIYSVLVKGRNITESNALVNLLPPRQGSRSDDRRPEIGQIGSQLLVEIRMSSFPVVRALWDSQILEKSSSPVLDKILDVLKTILTGEQEAAAYRRSNTTVSSVNFKAEPVAFGWSHMSPTELSRVDADIELAKEAMYRTNGRQDDAVSYCDYHKKGLAGERNPIPEEDAYRETPAESRSRASAVPSPSRAPGGTGAGAAADTWRPEPPNFAHLLADMTRASDDSPASDDSQHSRPSQTPASSVVPRPPTSSIFSGTSRATEPAAGSSSATPVPAASDHDRPRVTKDDLDEARADFRKNAIDRCLEVLQAHPDSVFEVAELIQYGILRLETDDQRREVGEILANALMSFASEDDKSSVGRSIAAYAHLLSLLLQDKTFYKAALPALKENIGAYLGFLKPAAASSTTGTTTGEGAQSASTPWIAYILLIFESLLADDETPVEVKWKVPTKEDETVEEPVLQEREPNLQPEEKTELMNDVLALLPHIGKDEALAVSALRILAIMTRDRGFAKEVGSRKQLQRLFVMTKQLCGAESARLKESRVTKSLMIILRHVIEDEETVRQIMRTEIKTFVENAARNPRTPDLNSYLRHLSHVALRNPKIFVEVTSEMVKFSRWTPPSSEVSSRQQPQPLLVLKESARSPPATSTQKTGDVSVDPAVQGTEDLTISDVKPSTETGGDKVMADAPKTPVVETKPPVLENPDGVVHFILSELLNYREVDDKEVASPPAAAVPGNDKDKDAKGSGDGGTAAVAAAAPEASTDKDKKPATPKFLAEEHPIFVYRCFLLNCLTELLQSYTRAKVEFINFKRNAPVQAATPVKPRSSVLNYLIHDLLCQNNMLVTADSIPLKKKAATSAAAQQVLVALVAKTGERPVARQTRVLEYDDEADLLFVRRFVLDTILKAYKGTCASSEPFDVRYAKMLSLAELMTQMIGGSDKALANPRGTDPSVSQTQAQLKRLMFEKGYLSALTASISELDLSFPDVKRTIKYILRVVKSLAKIAIALSHANLITEAQTDTVEDEIASASSLSDMEEEDDDREETPDLYRNSTLGMLEPGGDDDDYSEDEDEDDEMDYDEYGDEMDYDEEFSGDNEEDVSDEDEDELGGMGPIEGLPGDIAGDIEVVMDEMEDEDMDEDDEGDDDDEDDEEDDDDDDDEIGSEDMEELEDQVQIMDEEGNPVDDDGQSGWEDETDEDDEGDEDEEEIDYDADVDGFGGPGNENGLPGRLGHIMGALGLPVPGGDGDDGDMGFDPYGEDAEDDGMFSEDSLHQIARMVANMSAEDDAEDDDMDDDDLYYGGRDVLDDFNFDRAHDPPFNMPAGLGWDVVAEGGGHHRHRHGGRQPPFFFLQSSGSVHHC
jgi:E3 ubiquitin-protein ligase HUWE1